MPKRLPAPDTSTISAELQVVADLVERQRDRVGALAEPFMGTERDDIVSVVREAERQLLMAGRALRRAVRAIG